MISGLTSKCSSRKEKQKAREYWEDGRASGNPGHSLWPGRRKAACTPVLRPSTAFLGSHDWDSDEPSLLEFTKNSRWLGEITGKQWEKIADGLTQNWIAEKPPTGHTDLSPRLREVCIRKLNLWRPATPLTFFPSSEPSFPNVPAAVPETPLSCRT